MLCCSDRSSRRYNIPERQRDSSIYAVPDMDYTDLQKQARRSLENEYERGLPTPALPPPRKDEVSAAESVLPEDYLHVKGHYSTISNA